MTAANRALLALLVVLAAWIAITGVWIGIQGYAATPIADQWDNLAPEQFVGRLLAPHNEHRIILPRLIFLADIALARDTGVLGAVFVYVFNIAHVLLLLALARWTWPQASKARMLAIAAVTAAFFFSGFQFENFVSGFQNQFTGVFFFGSAAIASLAFGARKPLRERLEFTVLSMISAIACVCCMANGLLLMALMPILALALRLPATAGAYGCLAVGSWFLYLTGYPASDQGGLLRRLATEPLKAAGDFLAYLGGAVPNSTATLLESFGPKLALARIFGGVAVVGAALVALPLTKKGCRESPQLIAWVGIAAFIFASAAVTALGRGSLFEFAMLANRYGAGTAVLWSILAIWMMAPRSERSLLPAMIAAGAACLVLAAAQLSWLGGAQVFRYHKLDAEAALISNVDTPTIYKTVYPDASRLPTVAKSLRMKSLAMFSAPWRRLVGKALPAANLPSCALKVRPLSAVAGAADPTWRATLEGRAPSATRAIAVTAPGGRVIGLLIRGMTGDIASEPLGFRHEPRWSGFVRASVEGASPLKLDAFAVDASGEALCRLDQSIEIEKAAVIHLASFETIGAPLAGDLAVSSEGVFPENGEYVSARPSPFGGRTWGSWAGSEANVGKLMLTINPNGERRIILPFITGPRPEGTRMDVKANGLTIFRGEGVEELQSWKAIAIDVPEHATTLEITVEDAAKGWGGWIGVGEPRALCQQDCPAAAAIDCPTIKDLQAARQTGAAGFVDSLRQEGDHILATGWAVDLKGGHASLQVVGVANGVVLACGRPQVDRPDVANVEGGSAFLRSGFSLMMPTRSTDGLELFARQTDGGFVALTLAPGAQGGR